MVSVRLPAALGVSPFTVTKLAAPLPMKRTFWPPEQAAQSDSGGGPAGVPVSASTVEPPPPPVPGTTRISRGSPGRRLALYELATVPPLAPDHRSVTWPLPVKPTCDQLTETVRLPEVFVLNSATTKLPSASFLLKTWPPPLLTIRWAATPSWSTATTRS